MMKGKMVIIFGIKLSRKSAEKVEEYLNKYGEFEAYNIFGDAHDSIEQGIRKIVMFYKQNLDAPV